jgi:hypothetical protein
LSHFSTISDELDDLLSPSFSEDTAIEAQDLENEIVTLRERTKALRAGMLDIWSEHQDQSYELRAVFIHRGEPTFRLDFVPA